MGPQTFSRRLIDGATMFVVTGLSLLLLVYVGFGEAKRTYEEFDIEKLVAQGSIAQNSIENYLRAGLPLKQYVGFTNLAEPIVENEDIDALAVYDLAGRQLFFVTDKSKPKLPDPPAMVTQIKDKIEVESTGSYFQVVLPLRTRFETVGSVVVVSPKSVVAKRLDATFRPLVFLLVGLSVAFAVFVSLAAPYLARTRGPWLQVAYGLTFLGMAGFVIGSLINLYSDGIQGKAKETAFTLSQRLVDVVEFNLRIRDFENLDKMFADYHRLNPEIKEAALIVDDVILVDTDGSKVGKSWRSDPKAYEYTVDLTRPDQPRQVHVAVAVPGELVYHQVERSIRNFAALFVASCFFAGLFLQVAAAMQRLRQEPTADDTGLGSRVREQSALAVVKPIFFLAVFIESLTYSFLPRFMQDVAASSGVSSGFASAPFTTYYLCFALSLIPAGHFSERRGPRALIWSGLLLAGMSMLSLTMPLGIVLATVARGVSGIGQGMLFIGIQAYILAVASPEKKTQGAAIIVFGFQGGMISGMAIGSLLVSYLQPQGVFAIGAAVGLATALYSAVLMPRGSARDRAEDGFGTALTRVGGDMLRVMRSTEFLKTMFLIGVPAKAILTGIITFALPLLLGQEGFRQEEIGQVIMLYALAVVASSSLISRLVDRTGQTASMLFWGAVISGFGLVLIGLMGATPIGHGSLSTVLVVVGVMLVGGAHGFINAPVVTHIAHSELAKQIGANPATATYRFLERLGHVAGPIMVAQLFLIWGQTAQIVAWMGVATMILGIFFILRRSRPSGRTGGADDVAEIGALDARRLGLPQVMAAALVLTLFASPAQADGKPAYSKWFRYGPSIETAWQVADVPGEPLQVAVHRKEAEKHGPARRVLVLYPRPSSAYDIAITTILDVFETKEINADMLVVNFAIDDQKGKDALRLAQDGRYDLIIAMGSESTAWLYDHYRGGAIPVVSVCAKDPVLLGQAKDYDHGSGTNFAFTSLNMPTDVQFAYVQELKPELKNFAVLVDSKNVSAVQTQAEPIAALAKRRGIQVVWGAVQNPATAREELATIVRDAVHTMRKSDPDLSKSLFWVTGSTSVFREMKTINENADRVPVVSVVPEVVKAGDDTAVLAIGISFESNAHLAAIYAANILDGHAKAGELKVGVVSPPDIAISFRKAREIGLRVPFTFFESASFVYDYDGRAVRATVNKGPADN
ncbi:MAG TPA: MFS transporter [Stellaceae bacterium]|nr:MFS transporter [Stellaceae bacterium]